MRAFVTGCAGFIGSSLTDRLLSSGCTVVGIDDFSTGQRRYLESAAKNPDFRLIEADLLDVNSLQAAMRGADCVFHLAANADVRLGTERPSKDLEQNTVATHNVLESMRANGIVKIVFASTGSVYGEATVFPTPEDAPFPVQTSLYGASKLACEGLIGAYCEGFGFQSWIFRFVSILGERYSHGHVFDFYRQLRSHPTWLEVLGNGRQRKSYLYVQDCLDAVLLAFFSAKARVNLFNLGVDSYCEVNDSIAWISAELGLEPHVIYTGGDRGWAGDNPFIFLDTARMRALGWQPKLSIEAGIRRTVAFLRDNSWILELRSDTAKRRSLRARREAARS
ncbi:MAG TPA: NAD-dependent epimerase/dehydratase family protein [Steroidobacteraceae bacterium]